MINIAICDDEKKFCSNLERLILSYTVELKEQFNVQTFYSGETIYKSLQLGNYFDLIFLNIESKNINGLKIGRFLREELHNNISEIVYISSKQEYPLQVFESKPLQFLIKNFNENVYEIIRILKKVVNSANSQKSFFEFIYNRNFCKVLYNDILYFESNNKKVNLITASSSFTFYGKLSTIMNNLHPKNFIQIHKSYIINYLYLTQIQKNTVIMSNGLKLPISKSYKKQIYNKLLTRCNQSVQN